MEYCFRRVFDWGSDLLGIFLNFGTSWRWVVSFTHRPLYPRGKNTRYPLDRRLGGPQSRSPRSGEEKILETTGTRTPTPRSCSPYPVAIPTALYQLLRVSGEECKLWSSSLSQFLQLALSSCPIILLNTPFFYNLKYTYILPLMWESDVQ
jgi:hypothetical protein